MRQVNVHTMPTSSLGCCRGFTLVELLVTLALLGVLAMGAMPLSSVISQRAKEAELRVALRTIRVALDRHKELADSGIIERQTGKSGYPETLEALEAQIPVISSVGSFGRHVTILRRVPRDPFHDDEHSPTVSNARTWGLRSYQSTAESPLAGDDVFDVYSRSSKTGLNGVPYRRW